MKNLLVLLFIISCTPAFAQEPNIQKIKIKKQKALYKATLCEVDSGYAGLKQVIKEGKLKVTNAQDGIKIYAYEAFITFADEQLTSTMYAGKNAKLTNDLIKALETNTPIKLAFRNILAYNSFNETIQLNNVIINFIK